MAMTLSLRSSALLALALLGAACAGAGPTPLTEAVRVPRNHGAPVVLVLMPRNQYTQAVWKVLGEELASDFDVVPAWTTDETSTEVLAQVIVKERPSCIVLMDTAVRIYARYQANLPAGREQPPAVLLMTPFAEEVATSIVNASGIAYEIPSVVQFVALRAMIERPVRRVGVVYRAALGNFIRKQVELVKPEKMEIVAVEVPNAPSDDDVSAALTRLYESENVDCLWVLNDNGLLTSELIASVWLPVTTQGKRIPIIVGVSSLLNAEVKLGSFAMLPDHAALGTQAAKLIFDLADNGWVPVEPGKIEYPLAVRTVVDVTTAQKYFMLRKSALSTIDDIVK